MEQAFTVSQVNSYIKNMFGQDYVLSRIWLKGEVSNCKYHPSGHIYFTLKDETGQMACVMFASARTGLCFQLSEGQSVVVFGSISVYERDGKYQLYAKEIHLDGLGLLYEKYELLKKQLLNEGLFESTHKLPIPSYPKSIGIVTAKTGAAIQDIISISQRRNPYVQLILYPAKVQGENSAQSIVAGIKALDAYGVDTIIIGRGGGSIEDLWSFNEEIVARAIYECKTPIISAVGHETDTTIADYVADMRAPTPSAAAELAVNDVSLLETKLSTYHMTFAQHMIHRIQLQKKKSEQYRMKLTYASPMYQLRQNRQYLVDMQEKLMRLSHAKVDSNRQRLAILIERIKGRSWMDKLQSGFSYVQDEQGNNVRSVKKINKGDSLFIRMTDGTVEAVAKQVTAIDREV